MDQREVLIHLLFTYGLMAMKSDAFYDPPSPVLLIYPLGVHHERRICLGIV